MPVDAIEKLLDYVELDQTAAQLLRNQNVDEDLDHIILMQTTVANTVVDIDDSLTEECVQPRGDRGLQGDEGLWFHRLQQELHRLHKSRAVGAHVSQLTYMLRKYRIEGILAADRADALEALLAAWADEPSDERSCHADGWTEKWFRWMAAFLGLDDRQRREGPWCPNIDYLQALEATMFEEMQLEIANDVRASREQAADDEAMAEALSVPQGNDPPQAVPQALRQVPEGDSRVSESSVGTAKPKKRGPGGTIFPSPEIVPRVLQAVETSNGTSVNVRFVIRRYTHSVGTQTD